jgi:glycosidase
MLDFVPNHTAIDHGWVDQFPDYYVHGTEALLTKEPQNYIKLQRPAGELILAYGRDPYFAGWPDSLQLNYGNPELQEAMTRELIKIAGQCDGVRCDMAMLVLPEVFEKTWGIPCQPFWPQAIKRVREANPGFCLLAEVYWGMEWTLQQLGFDYTYDKTLYDRLKEGPARPVWEHFWADKEYQAKSARFLENHDELRAAAVFSEEKHEAAAVLTFCSMGLRFFYQGQLEGKKIHISIHLNRGPVEPLNETLKTFYDKLLAILHRPVLRKGTWKLLDATPAWEGNSTHDSYICFGWKSPDETILVVVNYAPDQSQCYLSLPFNVLEGKQWQLRDLFSDSIFERQGDDLQSKGLYLDEPSWKYYVFSLKQV